MNLVFLAHPEYLGLRSQAHFVRMLATACQARGHNVQVRQPKGALQQRARGTAAAKWAGYVDQYLLFPRELRRLALADAADTLYVFCDQALGPWVPAVAHRPHVVHCHDLLALRSALGEVAENRLPCGAPLLVQHEPVDDVVCRYRLDRQVWLVEAAGGQRRKLAQWLYEAVEA